MPEYRLYRTDGLSAPLAIGSAIFPTDQAALSDTARSKPDGWIIEVFRPAQDVFVGRIEADGTVTTELYPP